MEKCTPPETRTQNLLLRRQTPYPLGQWSIIDHLSTLYIISILPNWKQGQTSRHTQQMTETNTRVHSLLEHVLGPLLQVHSVIQILLHSSIELHSTNLHNLHNIAVVLLCQDGESGGRVTILYLFW